MKPEFVSLRRPGSLAAGCVAALLTGHLLLLGYSAWAHSPTQNEPGHLVAGLSHWTFGRFDLYRVNPPLTRLIAALPVLLCGFETDWSAFSDQPGSRPEFGMGENFVTANGEQSLLLFLLARWACIPVSLTGGWICYLWGRDLFGRAAGVLACWLWCFCPNILAHASLITPDVSGTAFGLAACYTFWKWLKQPTWNRAFMAGMTLGLAELSKTTLILLFPLWPVLWLVYRGPERTQGSQWLREAGMVLLVLVASLYVVNVGYGFHGSLEKLGDLVFVSQTFSGKPTGAPGNRFADTWIGTLPMPLPKDYVLGMDVQRLDLERGRRPYLRGQFADQGWWYYYLYALAVKVPLGSWGLFVLLVAARIAGKFRLDHRRRDECVLLLPATIIFICVSSQRGMNEHLRYVLPAFPFIFVWLSQAWRQRGPVWLRRGGVFLMVWCALSSLWIYPHSLSYFNESAGGPHGGAFHLLYSNIDWGQDLLYLRSRLDNSGRQQAPLYVAYFGRVDPRDVGIGPFSPVPHAHTPDAVQSLPPGTYVISVNLIAGSERLAPNGQGGRHWYEPGALAGFQSYKPTYTAGYSIKVFQNTGLGKVTRTTGPD